MSRVGQLSGLTQGTAAPRAAIPLRQAARISRQVVCAQRSTPCQQEQPSTSQRTQPLAKLSPFLAATVANLVTMLPAEAATGKIFDFNLTFFFMIGEFLLLMVFLEKTWFTPVGKVLDDRDSYIRDKLSSVGGTSEIKDLERQCEETLSKARSEAAALLDSAKKESTKAQNEAMDKAKTEMDGELAKAEKEIESEEKELLSNIDDIVDYVLNKTKEDLFASPVLSGAYEAGEIKGEFALPSGYSGEAPKGWEKP